MKVQNHCVWRGVFAVAVLAVASAYAAPQAPVTPFESGVMVREWVVLGPFDNPKLETPAEDGSTRAAYGQDLLGDLGGEAEAVIEDGAEVAGMTAKTVTADEAGVVDLQAAYEGEQENTAAYAFAMVQSKRKQEVTCFFASDDWAKVWVNGEQVHAIWEADGRGLAPRSDQFTVTLRKGMNRFLVKVEQNTGPWGFQIELFGAEEAAAIAAEQERKGLYQALMNAEIGPKDEWNYCYEPGAFPEIVWRDAEAVEKLHGEVPLMVRWFDGQMNEVETATEPGRYTAYVESTLPDGFVIRRFVTTYCRPADWTPWRLVFPNFEVPYIAPETVPTQVWSDYNDEISDSMIGAFMDSVFQTEGGAALMASLSELPPLGGRELTQLDWPDMRTQDFNFALKSKILGLEGKFPALKPLASRASGPATVLTPGTPEEAGLTPESIEAVRQIAREWNESEGVPLVVMVARNGKVALHEGFGETAKGPVTTATKFQTASLTKSHAGLMLAQFADQGVINLDDPVGKFLPGFPVEGPHAITLRMCMNHTTGYEGHGNWGGMNNAWLDNVMALGLPGLDPGKAFVYNGMSLDLAGRVMEAVAGESFFRLMHNRFFIPLGQDNPSMIDLGYGINCTVMDLGRVGQMMLNRGAYGDVEFISEKTFNEIVWPRPLIEFHPEMTSGGEQAYNLGLHFAQDRRHAPDLPEGEEAERLFSDNSLMHGSATGAVLRVDYDRNLVIAVARPRPDKDYGLYLAQLLTAAVDGVKP